MRILNVFGFFGILCINSDANQYNAFAFTILVMPRVTRKCNNLENSSPLLRLKKHLFCDYDNIIHPHYPKTTDVVLSLIPIVIEFTGDRGKLSLHSWVTLAWTDPHLTWTPSDYDGISSVHVKSWQIWMPDLCIHNFADISSDQYDLPMTECLLQNSGSIHCVPAVKFVTKCDPDMTYWPYDKHKCPVTFTSRTHKGEEVNFMLNGNGIDMSEHINDTTWDFKFISSIKKVDKYKCCPNDTFPKINYYFLLTRHYGKYQSSVIVPTIALMLLTLIVLCLDLKSVERMAVASVNFICHLISMYVVHWSTPYTGVNPPNILLFYRESMALATFAIILTALLRKLEDMSTEMPNWISFTITLVLSNKVGRFLIFKDESKIADRDKVTEESSDVLKSEVNMKESSWKYFAAIIDWLSFFCVILTYVIILITLITPTDSVPIGL